MTSDAFRRDAQRTAELAAVLSNPILQEALLLIHDSKAIIDAPRDADQLASVRLLSNHAGRSAVISELYELATPLAEQAAPKKPDYGVTEQPPDGWNESEHL